MDDLCFGVFTGTSVAREWNKARELCLRLGGELAVVETEIERKIIGDHLTNIAKRYPGDNIKVFLGIRKFGTWHWLDGSNISTSIWHSGYPDVLWSGECGVIAKLSAEWKLAQEFCLYTFGFICETDERKSVVMINCFQLLS